MSVPSCQVAILRSCWEETIFALSHADDGRPTITFGREASEPGSLLPSAVVHLSPKDCTDLVSYMTRPHNLRGQRGMPFVARNQDVDLVVEAAERDGQEGFEFLITDLKTEHILLNVFFYYERDLTSLLAVFQHGSTLRPAAQEDRNISMMLNAAMML